MPTLKGMRVAARILRRGHRRSSPVDCEQTRWKVPNRQESSIDGGRQRPSADRPDRSPVPRPQEPLATPAPDSAPNNRRRFLRTALAAATGSSVLAAGSREEQALWAWSDAGRMETVRPEETVTGLPYGRIGHLKVSRLICGGNLFSGFAHARDLVYVSAR